MKYPPGGLSGEDRKGIAIFLASLAVLATLVAIAVSTLNAPENNYDRATLCNENLPRHAHKVFVIDVSDALSGYQKRFLRRYIATELQQAGTNDRFSLYVLDEKFRGLSDPVVDVCKPKTGEDVSLLTSNRAFVDRLYADRFEKPLERALASVVMGGEQEISPIYEALSDLVALRRLDGEAQEVHLTIVSDMIQNSTAGSVFNSGPSAITGLPPINLRRARTSVLWLDREKYRQYQTSELERSWEEYLASVSDFSDIERVRP
ncbi:hypothetical protein SAMN05216212_0979 [Microbulbifer yueqingensis]|uniref:VWFA domain-containing protein n=2 Tax=Microbulbifer yueqingensis TaxID=658219 RepID=A0A1G8X830_9GAMM|nr:hypothetical protein SAMN05216212_0979 [Microbulbifer yueqingensis]